MISSPQEIEQNAVAIANWVVYNGRPFVLPTDDGKRMYLTVLNEDQMKFLNTTVTAMADAEAPKVTEE